MLKNICRLEHVVEDRVIHLLCDQDCPLSHLKDALFQFTAFVAKIEDQAKTQQEKVVPLPQVEDESTEE